MKKDSNEIFTVIRFQDNLIESLDSFNDFHRAYEHFIKVAKRYYNLPEESLIKYARKRILMDKHGNSVQLISHAAK